MGGSDGGSGGGEGASGKAKKGPIPWWGWVFAAGCGVIPVLTLGGALWGAIGFGGAAGCVGVSRNAGMSVGARVGVCAGIVAVCWGVFVAVIVGMVVMGGGGAGGG